MQYVYSTQQIDTKNKKWLKVIKFYHIGGIGLLIKLYHGLIDASNFFTYWKISMSSRNDIWKLIVKRDTFVTSRHIL